MQRIEHADHRFKTAHGVRLADLAEEYGCIKLDGRQVPAFELDAA